LPTNTLLEGRGDAGVGKARAMTADDLVARIVASGLRGRGGAGYPLGKKMEAVRANAARSGRAPLLVANAYDADPDSPISRTMIERSPANVLQGVAIAAHAIGAVEAVIYMHPAAEHAREVMTQDIAKRREGLGVLQVSVAVGPGGFMGGEESALMNVLESKRAMARQRPPYPAESGVGQRPTLIASAETIAWLPQIVDAGAKAETKLVSVTGQVRTPGVYEVALGTTLEAVLEMAGGVRGELKGIHVGGPTGGILSAVRRGTRLDFDDLRRAGTHIGSGQVRAIPVTACVVAEAAKLFAYLAKETCGICVPCRVGTARVTGILESVQSQLGRDTDTALLTELGDHMAEFSLCGFGLTAPSIIRTTMYEFPDDYRAHIEERRCPTGSCTPVRARRYETMAQP